MLMIGKLFVYENIRIKDDRKTVLFDYRVDTNELSFSLTETLKFPSPIPDSNTVDRLLRALHIALGISYYKTFLPPEINHAYIMNKDEAEFWNKIFQHGLSEFLYKNNLKPNQLAKFKSQDGKLSPGAEDDIDWRDTALLGIGGGKDSIVAGELLKELKIPIRGFVLATSNNEVLSQSVANKMELDLISIQREIDPQIISMNKVEGAYNGHIPISLIFALVGCLSATINGDRYVIVANEASASIPQITNENNEVNHQ
jgi:UDP-N-acetyl-alpha-D-muramoyl-L-alanyl-L-glutamate epimerase